MQVRRDPQRAAANADDDPLRLQAGTEHRGKLRRDLDAEHVRAVWRHVQSELGRAPADVADAVWRAATSGRSGECWFVQPGREPAPFRFPNLPGPRVDGEKVGAPPG